MPQPDGPISEMNSPGWNSSSMLCSAVVPPLPNVFETFRIETAAASRHATFSGARRTTRRSAIATMEKKRMPRAAAMMFVAQSAEGSSE